MVPMPAGVSSALCLGRGLVLSGVAYPLVSSVLQGTFFLCSVLAGLWVGLGFPVAKAPIPALGVLRTCLLTAVLKLCSLLLVATTVASKGTMR